MKRHLTFWAILSLTLSIAGGAWAHGYGGGWLEAIIIVLLFPPLAGLVIGLLFGILVFSRPMVCLGVGVGIGVLIDLSIIFSIL